MTQERTARAALDTKDNKDLTKLLHGMWYQHHDIIIYFFVLYKPMCENFKLVAMEANKNQNILCYHFQLF